MYRRCASIESTGFEYDGVLQYCIGKSLLSEEDEDDCLRQFCAASEVENRRSVYRKDCTISLNFRSIFGQEFRNIREERPDPVIYI